jgi:hypothetical protein
MNDPYFQCFSDRSVSCFPAHLENPPTSTEGGLKGASLTHQSFLTSELTLILLFGFKGINTNIDLFKKHHQGLKELKEISP